MTFTPHTPEDFQEMLKYIGVSEFDELIQDIPSQIKLDDTWNFPDGLSELEIIRELEEIAAENITSLDGMSFMGGGAYNHFIPAVIDFLISRSEFTTAYTPYQAEVSQGTLQAIYEFQTLLCNLTNMEVANASMYDGGSASAEAALLACSMTGRNQIVIAGTINPLYRQVIQTYCSGLGIHIDVLQQVDGTIDKDQLIYKLSNNTAGVIFQHPNF